MDCVCVCVCVCRQLNKSCNSPITFFTKKYAHAHNQQKNTHTYMHAYIFTTFIRHTHTGLRHRHKYSYMHIRICNPTNLRTSSLHTDTQTTDTWLSHQLSILSLHRFIVEKCADTQRVSMTCRLTQN